MSGEKGLSFKDRLFRRSPSSVTPPDPETEFPQYQETIAAAQSKVPLASNEVAGVDYPALWQREIDLISTQLQTLGGAISRLRRIANTGHTIDKSVLQRALAAHRVGSHELLHYENSRPNPSEMASKYRDFEQEVDVKADVLFKAYDDCMNEIARADSLAKKQ